MRAHAESVVPVAVARALATHRPFASGAPVVVAVSGGPDSLCLLGTLLALREAKYPDAPDELVVATFDHGVRGAASAADAQWVADFAAARGLRCVGGRGDALAVARSERLSLEDAARRLRYAFLRRVASEVGADRICLGHTRDDQAETIALNWLRGAGLAGLAGMRPVEGDLVRPLLDVTHAQTRAYCAAQGWQAHEDPTNDDPRYTRNRIRHELLPLLETFNPNLRQTLTRNADLIADDERYLDAQTDAAWPNVLVHDAPPAPTLPIATQPSPVNSPSPRGGGARGEGAPAITFALDALQEQPLALQRRLLRRAAQRLLAGNVTDTLDATPNTSAQPLEARHIALLERLLTSGHTGATLDLPNGLRARRDYITLTIERRDLAPGPFPHPMGRGDREGARNNSRDALSAHPSPGTGEGHAPPAGQAREGAWRLSIPGVIDIPELGWRLRAARIERPAGLEGDAPTHAGAINPDDAELPPIPALPPIAQAGTAAQLPRAELRVYLDADRVGPGPLLVRAWRPGDRFMPLGMEHEKKLQDYFADARVPRALRKRLPIVVGPAHILWVATQRIDQRARITPATRHILALQCEPLE